MTVKKKNKNKYISNWLSGDDNLSNEASNVVPGILILVKQKTVESRAICYLKLLLKCITYTPSTF